MWPLIGQALVVLAGLVYVAGLLRLVCERDEQRNADRSEARREAEGLDMQESAGPVYGPLHLIKSPKALRVAK